MKKYGTLIRGRVLDIGAGDQPYRKHFPEAAPYTATNTRRFYSCEGQDAIEDYTDVWIEDASDLPFEDESFDAVVCFQVLSVLPKPEAFFKECSRVLSQGGQLLVTTDFLYPKWSVEDAMRHTDYSLGRMAGEAGFTVETLESFGGFATMIHSCTNRYMRDYPQLIRKSAGRPAALFRMTLFLLFLAASPLFGLLGLVVYRAERELADAFGYSVNNLLICRKGR